MAKAASRLAISHPVISKTISDLEQTLGVRLLDRNARGVEPTVYGQALLKCGVAVFDEMRQGLTGLEFLTNPNSGDLRIGCPEAMAAGLLPVIAERFSRSRAGARLHVFYANTERSQFDELRNRNVDLVICPIPNPFLEEELVVENLFDERIVAVAGAHSRWARRRRIDLRELVEELWVLTPQDSVPGKRVVEIFRANGLEVPRAGMVSLSIHFTIALVATGRFLALLPASVVRFNPGRSSLKMLPVKLAMQRPTTVGVVTVRNRTISPLAQSFIDYAREMTVPLAKFGRMP
jgi:DNA-binding transcriptional LysR family regulator